MARYEEVAVDLERRIRDGEWAAGESLPTTTALMESYGNSKETIRAAVEELAKRGLVRVIKRRGSIVQDLTVQRRRIRRNTLVMRDPRRGYIFPAASSAGEPWEVHGQPRRAFTPIPDDVAEHLSVEPGIEVMRRRRVTSPAGEPPFQIVDAWIHPEALTEAPQAGEISTGPGGYLDRIEEAGHGPLSWEEVTRTRMPSKEEAKLLAISPSTPVLEMATIGISSRTDRAVEVSVRVIPGDRAEILSKLERADSAVWPVAPVQS